MSARGRWKLLGVLIFVTVVLGGAGSYFTFYRQSGTQISTNTRTATAALSTQAKLYTLYGKLFFDYSGDGIQQLGEPPLPSVVVALDDRNVTSTNSTGWYVINDVVKGNHTVRPFPPKNFGYMCESPAEFKSVKEFYGVLVGNNTRKDIGLMEGYLTLPFASNTVETDTRVYVDVTLGGGRRDWQGGRNTYSGHLGTDFLLPIGIEILAAAPGLVVRSYRSAEDGNVVTIQHPDGKPTIYCHLSERKAVSGQKVSRGAIIGLSGHTGEFAGPTPHLHFQFGDYGQNRIDPYRDLLNPLSVNYWTVDNKPQYPA